MSTAVRDQLAQAASTVDGVQAQPYFAADTTPGTAYPRLDRIEYPNRFGGIAYWDLVVVLPQDLAESERYVETVGPQLVDALGSVMAVDRVAPQQLQIPGVGTLPVVFVSGHRED